MLSKLREEIVAAIADELGEIGPVRLLKSKYRGLVIRTKALQLEHLSNLACLGVRTTGVQDRYEDTPSTARPGSAPARTSRRRHTRSRVAR